ncbi:MAG: lipoprotein-releasing system transmembrane subunit LolC [Rhodospirillaceae bacterium TMED8]|nr:lipoprotein-releasing system transmembrane subunit LolC [Magnetovibrio sp.]OUT51678.1 MAG: lipoprotein-releasing system transmembrane subunit LolC [Rhodospirillaceae bacterium TMED8]|tara:strand:+ start:820 stop:2043 length:1224 start_codon:yes stop_codon:yes gene_type:complete
MIAFRYLRTRRQEGFISVIAWFSLLGIALGVATLIIVMAVMNGFREELLTRILGLNGHISVYANQGQLTAYDKLAAQLKRLDGVINVTPMIEGQVMVTSRGASQGAIIRGIRPTDLLKRDILASNIVSGNLRDFNGTNKVIIGQRMADKLGVNVGDKITLISPKGSVTAFGTMPILKAYQISATFNIGMFEYDSSFVFMPLNAAQVYFKLRGAVTNLEVFGSNPDAAPALGENIRIDMGSKVKVHDWQHANANFFNAIEVERNVMFLILTLIIIVAAFNIISSMIMLVKDKGKDIAILRTMGATRGMIMRVFFLAGASVGTIGTIAGFGLGLLFATNIEIIRQWIQGFTGTELFAAEIYFLSKLPAVVDPSEVITVVIMGLGLSFAATLYPSWRAAQTDPAEALRYE